MLFIIESMDKSGALDLRLKTREKHLQYLDSLGEKLILAGPFLDKNEKPNGSMIIIRADNISEAKSIADKDPYKQVGLFATSSIRAWLWAINNKEGIK